MKNTFARVADFKWKRVGYYSVEEDAVETSEKYKKLYPNAKVSLTVMVSLRGFESHYLYIEFKNEADEAEFIMRESL